MSGIFEGFLSTSEVLETFADRSFVIAMLRFEAALARAQAEVGLIPQALAQSIIGTCKVDLLDVQKIVRESGRAGSVATALVSSLKETVAMFNPAAATFVHYGSTSQDVIDTAMVLITAEALSQFETDVQKCITALLALAQLHANTPILARTLMQPTSVTSFGLKCAGWALPLVRGLQRLRECSQRALSLQLGGSVGTLSQMGENGEEVAKRMAQELKLNLPMSAWHTQRDEWVGLGCAIGLIVGSLGKIALDISLMSQFEVGEVAEPAEPDRGVSSAMAHKKNPVGCMLALAAAQRVPQRVAALLAAMPQAHERALGAWRAELAEWAQLMLSACGSARALAQVLPALQVNSARMQSHIDAVRSHVDKETAHLCFGTVLARHAAQLTFKQITALQAALTTVTTQLGH